ncbi:MAG: MTH938/NDUFAF3 family protein [Candidatus Thermoplasmatota archaeon]
MLKIEETDFGEITLNGETYDHDIVIFPNEIIERKKWITKEKHGTSHKFTRDEMEEYLNEVDKSNIDRVVIGTGQYGKLGLLSESKEHLDQHDIEYSERKTSDLVGQIEDHFRNRTVFIIHVTC